MLYINISLNLKKTQRVILSIVEIRKGANY